MPGLGPTAAQQVVNGVRSGKFPALAALCILLVSCRSEPTRSGLSAWVERTTRPGFHLLDSAATADHYIAVYDTGKDEIAVCDKWIGTGDKPTSSSCVIKDASGEDLKDHERDADFLSWDIWIGLPNFLGAQYSGVDGMVYPIRRGYDGAASIEFSVGNGLGHYRRIYAKTIELPPIR